MMKKHIEGKKKLSSDVCMPCEPTLTTLKVSLQEDINTGNYHVGIPIILQEFRKMVIGDNGSVTEEKFLACGRKIPLITNRKKLLEREEQFMRLLYDFSPLEENQKEELYETFVSKTYTSREEAETIMTELSNTRHIQM